MVPGLNWKTAVIIKMNKNINVRVDKFLWSVRIYKTRSQAADACKKGRVTINDMQIKPSRIILVGEVISVKKTPVVYSYKILESLGNRVAAKLVANYISDITTKEELDKLDLNKRGGFYYREKGTGRPTKKERRIIDLINEQQ